LYNFGLPEKRTFKPIAFHPKILYNTDIEQSLEIRPFPARADFLSIESVLPLDFFYIALYDFRQVKDGMPDSQDTVHVELH